MVDKEVQLGAKGQTKTNPYRVLIPILNPNLAQDLVELAQAISGYNLPGSLRKLEIVVLGVVQIPETTSLSEGASLVRAYRTMLRYIPPENADSVEVRTEVRVAREIWQGIADQVREDQTDLLLLHWKGFSNTPGKIYGATLDELMRDPPCDIALARFNNLPSEKGKVLLPIRGSSYSALALHFASCLVNSRNGQLTILHSRERLNDTVTNNSDELEPGLLQSLGKELPPHARLMTVYGPALRRIASEASSYDLVIVGAGAAFIESEMVDVRLAKETNRPLLVVKTHRPLEIFNSPSSTDPSKLSLAEEVDRWFAENTFHYREFRTMSSLTILKERNNLSVSLIYPVYSQTSPVSLSEAVRRARFALIHDCALVDEIIVAVSSTPLDPTEINLFYMGNDGQTDHSHNQDEIVFVNSPSPKTPTSFSNNGPAYAFQAALARARGDIIVWADPTIPGFEARLVYGLVGPLLSNPALNFATGFYSNPHNQSENNDTLPKFEPVTDLALRPLLGTFFPQLSGILDPLCAVGAARRDLLERLPLFSDQGFNVGLLIDTLQRQGLMSIAQVDLGVQPGSNKTLSPQQLVNQALTVLMHRLEERSQSNLLHLLDPVVKTVQKIGNVYSLQIDKQPGQLQELPPLVYNINYVRNSFQ